MNYELVRKKIGTILIIGGLIPLGIGAKDGIYFFRRNSDAESLSRTIDDTINDAQEYEEKISSDNVTSTETKYDFDKLREINPDIIGVLEGDCFEGGHYPVVSSESYEDLNRKLSQDLKGNYSSAGLIIADPNNDENLSGNFRIWGHHFKGEEENGLMFSSLVNYDSDEYYQNHKTLKYYTEDREYILHVYACTKDDPMESEVLYQTDTQEYIDNNINNSLINTGITPDVTDLQVVLVTCTRAGSDEEPDLRIQVHTVATPVKEYHKIKTKKNI